MPTIVIAGGADSLSKPPILYDDAVVDALMAASSAKDLPGKVRAFASLRPKDLAPRPPALADLSSGLTMGDAAEKMARENGITREAQDQYAYESHMKAVEAWEKGVFDDEVMSLPVPPRTRTPRPATAYPAPTPRSRSSRRCDRCSTASTAP